MKVRMYVQTNRVGSKIEDVLEFSESFFDGIEDREAALNEALLDFVGDRTESGWEVVEE